MSTLDKSSKFSGDGLPFKGRLFGFEELPVDRGEKECLDSMFKLKAVSRAIGEHKRRIQLNLSIPVVRLVDTVTKVPIAIHEIERISFVAMDPHDTHAFGYIYNTSGGKHQFWAFKTERSAAATALALKELFIVAFELYKNSQNVNVLESTTTSTPDPSSQLAGKKALELKSQEVEKVDSATTIKVHQSEDTVAKTSGGFPGGSTVPSPFYNACRDNSISLVEHYLQRLSLEEVNQMEPNGSTALHVAAYQGHDRIVELLLQKGARCATKNKYNSTPLDEAKTDQIKQLIRRRMNKTRFVSDSIEWIISTNDADFQAHQYLNKLETYGNDPSFYQLIIYIKKNYIDKDLQHIQDIHIIQEYFDMAIKEKDPLYLVKAYTAETGFYSVLNMHLAKLQLENLTEKENLSRAYYIGIIAHHQKFQGFSYTGKVFRGMIITNADVKQYQIGTRILTKTFSSASKQFNIALQFLGENSDTSHDRLSTICTYEIRNEKTALDIQHISCFQYEEEVLILPYSAFKIIDIQINQNNLPKVEIKLKECERW